MKKYNNQLFIIGFLMNIFNKFPLLLIAIIFGIVGIWVQFCQFVAVGLVLLIIVWSLVQQIHIKHTVENSDNPNFIPFANAMMSENWKEEIKELIEKDNDEFS